MKRIISTIILSALSIFGALAGNLNPGDTLRIGNELISKILIWDGTFLRDVALCDHAQGKQYELVAKYRASAVEYERVDVPADTIHHAHAKHILTISNSLLKIRREYRVYQGVSAIACDNFFSGESADFNPSWVMESLALPSSHWTIKAVEFFDATDNHDTLVKESFGMPFWKNSYRGNLLFASDRQNGIWMLKEAPSSRSQLAYLGKDFETDGNIVKMVGVGIRAEDISVSTDSLVSDVAPSGVKAYSSVIGIYDGSELDATLSLRKYQKALRRHDPLRDEMVMMNTWGDRNRDARVGERFCIEEVQKAARLGISHFQIDDGWQTGKSPNSASAGGSFKNIWDNHDYWTPDPVKYPNGLTPVVEAAAREGIVLGLWYNPSIKNDFANWRDDADAILGLWRKYGIKVFKIDGVELPNKKAEANFRRILDTVLAESGNDVVFNLDVTAGRRGGYFMFNDYGNLFLENRYSDWRNYYPYRTLRNLWMLSRYVPAENLQIEFLNNWRNADKYAQSDVLAPTNYDFEYLFALTMAGQPLAWMEASNLPEEGFALSDTIRKYRSVMADFHKGYIVPIGSEPSGYSWTGFQSIISENAGYLIVYREKAEQTAVVPTALPSGVKVKFTPVVGPGRKFTVKTCSSGSVKFSLPAENSYALYKYEIF